MTIHFVSSPADQLRLTVRGQGSVGGSIGQRLLVVQRTLPLGASIRAITRANDGSVVVLTANELVTMSADLGVVSRMTNRGGANLTHTSRGAYLWGPSGAFLVTRSGLRPIVGAAVHAVEVEPAQIVLHSDNGLFAASDTGVARLDVSRIRPTTAPTLGAVFMRLSGQPTGLTKSLLRTSPRADQRKLVLKKSLKDLPHVSTHPSSCLAHPIGPLGLTSRASPFQSSCTMQLVATEDHEASFPHGGSVAQLEKKYGVEYESPQALDVAERKGWLVNPRPKKCKKKK